MSSKATPRIVIEDLPPLEQISDAELADLFGAGRTSFRPTLEALEDRTLMSVNVVGISATPFSPTNHSGAPDTTAITIQHSGSGTDSNIKVLIENNTTVIRTLDAVFGSLTGANKETLTWDGRNAAGMVVPDGTYNVVIDYNALSPTGKLTTSPSKSVVVDTTAPVAPTNLALRTGRTLTNNNRPTIAGNAEPASTVKLYDGSTLIGSAVATSAGTFSITPATALSDGTHTLTATVMDAAGNTGPASSALSVTVDTTPPAAPTNLALNTGGTLTNNNKPTITGNAEAGSTVTLYSGITVLGSGVATSAGSFSITLTQTLSNGLNSLTAKATDTAGNNGPLSAVLSITVDTRAPNPPTNLALSKGGPLTNNNKPTITGSALVGSTVKLYDGSTLIGSAVATSAGTFSITLGTALSDGAHALTATATNAGHTGAASAVLNLVVDTTPPLAPTSLALSTGRTLTNNNRPTITGNAEAGSTVKLYDGSTLIGTAVATSAGTFSITPATALSDGTHTLTVIATDAAGNTGPASVTLAVTIDTKAPAVTLTPPGVVNKADQSSVTVSGTSEAGATITLTITDANGTTVSATTTTGTNGVWSITNLKLSGLTDGTLTYSVTATDAAGNTSTAVSSTAIKDTVPPVAPTNLALASGTFSPSSYPTITGSAEAGSTVTLYEGTTVVGIGIANAVGTFSITVTTALVDGVHSLTATATDAAGNTGPTSSASSIVVDLPLTAGALIPPQAVEGQVLTNAVIFHFTDADPAAQASYYTATVQTGDGTTLTSSSNPQNVQVVANPNGGFDVLLSYGYADELVNGTFAVQVADQGGESTGASTSSFTVADAPLTATGKNITTTKGAPFCGVVGTFTDANPFATAANFSATITWGDGQTSAGTIAYDSANKVFTVTGSNTYAAQGDYVVAVTITDVGGSTALATSTATMVPLVSLTGASAPLHIGGNGSFTLNLDGNSVPLDVTLSVDPSSTLAGYAFGGPGVTVNGTTLTVHFDPGQVSATITLTPLNPTGMAEAASTLTLDLQSGSGYTLSPTQKSATADIAANGFQVTNTNASGNGSLAQAVANANADTTGQPIVISFAAAAGQPFATAQTIQLPGTLELSNTTAGASISIQGPAAGLTIQGGRSKASFAVFTVDAGVTAMLDGLTITNGSNLAPYAVGGAISNAGTLTVSNSVISGNTASYGGGGIGNTGVLTVTDCTFSNNSATNNYGGGIYNSYGTVTVTGCAFSGNSAGDGGGIYNYYAYYGHGTLAVSNSTFSGNSAIWAGGGILDYGALTVNNSTFIGNAAPSGGGIALVYGGNATLNGTTLADNGAGSDLYLDSGSGSTVSATSIQIDSGSYAQVITATDTTGGTNVYLVDPTGAVFVYQANHVSAQQVGTSSVQTTDGTLWFLGTGSLDSGGVYTLSGGKLSLVASGVTALAAGVDQGVPSVFELRSDGTVWAASSLTNAHLVGTVTQTLAGSTVNEVATTFYVLDSGTILAWNGQTCASILGVQQWVTCDYQSQVSMAVMQTNGYLSVWTGTNWVGESSNCAQLLGSQTYVPGTNFVMECEDQVFGWNGTQFQKEPGLAINNVWMACTYNGQVTAALLLPDRTVDVWTGRAWAQIGTSGVLFDDICIWYVAGTDPASGQKLIENVGTQFVASIPNGLANALYNGIAGASLTDVVVALHSGISYIYPWQIADALQSVNGATIDSVASALVNANLGWSVNAIAAAVQGAFGAGDQAVASALHHAEVASSDIATALNVVFNDGDQAVAGALHNAGMAAGDIATALKTVFGDSDQATAGALLNAGLAAGDIATALKSVFGDTDQQTATILTGLSASSGDIATAMKSVFGDTDQQTAGILQGLGASTSDIATSLKNVYGDSDQQSAGILNNLGTTPSDIAVALKNAFSDNDLNTASILHGLGSSPTDIATALKNAFGDGDQATAGILSNLGASYSDIARVSMLVFGDTDQATAGLLKNVGAAPGDIASVLQSMYGSTDRTVGSILIAQGNSATAVAMALKNVFGDTEQVTAGILNNATVAPGALAAALKNVFGSTDQATAGILKSLNASPGEIASALANVFNDNDQTTAGILNALQTSIEDIAAALKSVYGDSDQATATVISGLGVNGAAGGRGQQASPTDLATMLMEAYADTGAQTATVLTNLGVSTSDIATALSNVYGGIWSGVTNVGFDNHGSMFLLYGNGNLDRLQGGALSRIAGGDVVTNFGNSSYTTEYRVTNIGVTANGVLFYSLTTTTGSITGSGLYKLAPSDSQPQPVTYSALTPGIGPHGFQLVPTQVQLSGNFTIDSLGRLIINRA